MAYGSYGFMHKGFMPKGSNAYSDVFGYGSDPSARKIFEEIDLLVDISELNLFPEYDLIFNQVGAAVFQVSAVVLESVTVIKSYAI